MTTKYVFRQKSKGSIKTKYVYRKISKVLKHQNMPLEKNIKGE